MKTIAKNLTLNKTSTAPNHCRAHTSRIFLACACVVLLGSGSQSARADGRQFVHNAVPAAVAKATKVRPSLKLEKLNMTIGLPLRNREELTNTLQQIYDPASPNFHHYLTPEQFTEKFGPTQEDYEAVISFAHAQGLTVIGRHSNRLVVGVRGTVGNVERAFHVRLNEYQHPTEARTFRAPDTEPSLDLAVPVLSIAGLDNYIIPHPWLKPMPATPDAQSLHPSGNAKPQAGSGPSGTYYGKDFRAAYAGGATQTGTGQIVGLFELDSGFYQSDMTAFENSVGEPNVPVIPVLLDGYGGGEGSAGGNQEVSLDIEMAIGMAPGLQEVLVFEGSTADDILSAMTTYLPLPRQLSASWTYSIDATSETLFMEMAAQGQSYFNASGDSDAYAGAPSPPTDDPNITVVGGTELSTTGPAGSWTAESVWNQGGGEGSSGGISTHVAIPTWQQGISMSANQGSTTMRNLPDVAMCAYNVEVFYGNGSTGAFVGTSCAAPAWAGFMALVNQLAVASGQPAAGFINPAVYSIGKGSNSLPYSSLFHDVTIGNNENSSSPTKYLAATGYDLCTGWGSPAGTNLLTALALPEPLRISPFVSDIFSGPVGGPFNPGAQTYTLTNNGGGSLNWALPTPPAWLDISPTSGTLVSGGPAATVTLSIDPSSANLQTGDYTTVLEFTNLNDNFAQTLTVTLAVVVPPVIVTQPADQPSLVGSTAIFSVGTATNALLYYQWQENGTNLTDKSNLSGSTTSNLMISNVTSANVASYSVIVSNAAGTTVSSNALLSIVASQPVVVSQTTNLSVLPGSTASLSVGVVGNTPYTYHWMFNGTNLANGTKFGGVTTATMFITNVITTNAGNYTVSVSNSLGMVTSAVAVVSIIPVTAPPYALTVPGSFPTGTGSQNPYSGLTYDGGSYYGTAFQGGKDGIGTMYRVTTSGTITTEHSFLGGTDGGGPVGSLCLAKDGNLYGVSYQYGTYGGGALFKVSTIGILTALIQFNGENGAQPVGGLMQAGDNAIWGTANGGGPYGLGTIYRVTSTAGATNLATLVEFNGANGAYPSPVLVQGTDGNLYGTAENGGDYVTGAGTIFRISLSGKFTVLYSFNGVTDGAVPIAGLIQGVDGNFYGTTLLGGDYNEGTVFQITPSGDLTTLYSFTGAIDGSEPWGGLVQATDGNLYGTTQQGGTYGFGTVFQIAPAGTLNTIAQFDGYQGAACEATLVQNPDGNLYGATFSGGSGDVGAFFSVVLTNGGPLQIDGQPADLSVYGGANAVFAVATAGGAPLSYQWLENGTNLANGGGISGVNTATLSISNVVANEAAAYSVIVSNTYNSVTSSPANLTVAISQPVIVDQPVSQTVVAGSIATFGVSVSGDQPLYYQWQNQVANLTDTGTISGSSTATLTLSNVALSSSGSYSVIVTNALAGVTSSVVTLTVVPANASSAAFTNLHAFTGGNDGANPTASLIRGVDGNLYGTASSGGSNFQGTIFRCTLAGTVTSLYGFEGSATGVGGYPYGGLLQTPTGYLYGTTSSGGTNNIGTFFRLINYTSMSFLYSFVETLNGASPQDTLAQGSDGNFYGTAYAGGQHGSGSVFRVTPNGPPVTLIYSFTGLGDGGGPIAGLTRGSNGTFYGTTTSGGSSGNGTVFNLTTNGLLTTLVNFDVVNGADPLGGVVQARDGNYYGTTSQGGDNGYGTVFQLSTNTGLTTLLSFNGANGAFPSAGLITGTDGNLYGTTSGGGIGDNGTAFVITTNGALTTLVSFDGFNGADPQAALVQAADGNFYGTAGLGGTGFNPSAGGGNGTIFRFTVPIFTNSIFTLTSAIAALPYTAVITNRAIAPPGDTLTFGLVSGPAWLNVAGNGVVSGAPPNANIGSNVFVVSLTDTNGVVATATATITVNADPPPTFLTNLITGPSANAGQPYTAGISNYATATYINSGDVLTFALVSGPSWLNVAANGSLSGTPGISNVGTNNFIVSVTDLGGGSNTTSLTIYVTPPTPTGISSQPSSLTNYAGTTASFTVGATASSPLSYQWYFGTNALAGQTNSTLTLVSVGPSNVGSYQVTATSLGGSTNSLPATLTVLYQVPNVSGGQLIFGASGFRLSFSGPPGQTYEVLASANLAVPENQWTVLGTGTFGSTNAIFTDPNATNTPYKFYNIKSP